MLKPARLLPREPAWPRVERCGSALGPRLTPVGSVGYNSDILTASARCRGTVSAGPWRDDFNVLSEDEKAKLGVRLRRISGQVAAVQRMVDDDTYCVDTLTQIAAASGALGKVSEIILESHIRSCVAESLREGSESDKDKKLEELIALFRKFGRPG